MITCQVCVCNNNFIHVECARLLSQRKEVNAMYHHRGVFQKHLEICRRMHTSLPKVGASELPAEKQAHSGSGPASAVLPCCICISSRVGGLVFKCWGLRTVWPGERLHEPKQSCVSWVQNKHPRQTQLGLWCHISESHFKAIIRS